MIKTKNKKLIILILSGVISFQNFTHLTKATSLYSDINSKDNIKKLDYVDIVGSKAIIMDSDTKNILWDKNSSEKISTASTTKIMTAIIALENSNPYDIVTVSKWASSMPSIKLYLKQGELVTMESLIYAILLQSSNDAAVAIADHIAGTEESFARIMTEKAKKIGAINTKYLSASGLDLKLNPYSTAYDQALIMQYALSNKEFVKIANSKNFTFATSIKKYTVTNKNLDLRDQYPNIIGKTGYTNKAKHCFVSSINYNNKDIIVVILSSDKKGKWQDTEKMFEYAKQFYN